MKIVTTKQLAAAIGRTPRRVEQLYRSGIIGGLVDLDGQRIRGAFPLWECVRDFADYKTRSRPGRPSVAERDSDCIQSIFEF